MNGPGPGGTGLADFIPGGQVFALDEAARASDPQAMAMAIMPGSAAGRGMVKGEAQALAKKIRAYHGSPHDFDRFDLSKIGTGEGAQAYGHGLYFAEDEGVARSYKNALSSTPDGDEGTAHRLLTYRGKGDHAEAERIARELAEQYKGQDMGAEYARAADILGDWRQRNYTPGGRMYEVEIDADPAQFLDWDAPLDAHAPEIQEIMRSQGYSAPASNLPSQYRTLGYTTGPEFKNLDEVKRLADAGIPGIKYLDAGSRGAGDGSRNYVTFRDDIVKILRKYGVASMAALPPAVQLQLALQKSDEAPPDSGF